MSCTLNAAAVACGGAVGAVCRFTLNDAIMTRVAHAAPALSAFPYGILCINVLGGLLMGLLQGGIARSGKPHAALYSLLGTGFLGGFTTFSTFSMDTFVLYTAGAWTAALYNVGANVVLGVAAAGVGYALVRAE